MQPMAFIVEQAGGKASDGFGRIIQPTDNERYRFLQRQSKKSFAETNFMRKKTKN
jgi:fructose-1,6-bisphosphatase